VHPQAPEVVAVREEQRIDGHATVGVRVDAGRFLSPESAALLDTLIEDEFR